MREEEALNVKKGKRKTESLPFDWQRVDSMISLVEHLALHGVGVVAAELVHDVVAAPLALAVPSRQKSTTSKYINKNKHG